MHTHGDLGREDAVQHAHEQGRIEPLNPTQQEIVLECAGRCLRADLRSATGPAAALVLHGWTGSRAGSSAVLADTLQAHGVSSLTLDLPGHGNSDGVALNLTRVEFLAAAICAYDELPDRFPDAPRRLVVGTSFGAYFAALLTAERRVAALVLRVPANYPDEGFATSRMRETMGPATAKQRWAWLSQDLPPAGSRALLAAHRFAGPVLLLEAGADDVIPPQTVANYEAAARAGGSCVRRVVVLDSPHAMSRAPDRLAEANQRLLEWLDDVVLS